MDGNPRAGPASIDEALDARRALALAPLPRRGARARGRDRRRRARSSRSRTSSSASLARDEQELPEYAAEIGARNELEPYRRKLSFMWWRLGNDGYRDAGRAARRPAADPRAASRANGGARIADGRVARLERMVEIFGFHVAKLDVRLHARELERPRARDAVAAADAARRRHGPAALDTLIVSGTSVGRRRRCARST